MRIESRGWRSAALPSVGRGVLLAMVLANLAAALGTGCKSRETAPAAGPTAREWHARALRLADESRHAEALAALDHALALAPDDAGSWANRGTALLNLGRYEEAIASYERSLALRPESAYAHCSLASTYHALGQPDRALDHAERALTVDASFAPAMFNKARALRTLGRDAEAQALEARAREFMPEPGDRPGQR